MKCDKKSLLAEEDVSKKHNLMVVGGHADNTVDLCAEDNTDAKRQYLGKGQTMLTKQPTPAEFEECWSEVIIKNGLSPSLVDDPLFRNPLVTTARMKAPGVKDFSKMKDQYVMFVDVVTSKQVCVSIIYMTLHYTQLCQTQLVCTSSF
jgi:hypothetical protein